MLSYKQKHRIYLRKAAMFLSNIDGYFIECGVKYGTSAIILAKELKCQGYLFDTWDRRESITTNDGDKKRILKIQNKKLSNAKSDCEKAILKNNVQTFCTLIQGDVCKTLPIFLKNNPQLLFKLIHLDTDLYLSTKIPIFEIWNRLVNKGIIFIHDYGDKKWIGVKKAVDEFRKENKVFFFIYPDICACLLSKELINFQSNIFLI